MLAPDQGKWCPSVPTPMPARRRARAGPCGQRSAYPSEGLDLGREHVSLIDARAKILSNETSTTSSPTTVEASLLGAAIWHSGRQRLRIGEALGLNVSDVDFLRRTVKVERQRLPSGEIGPVKTLKSARTVPLGQVVIDELAAHLASYPSDGPLFALATDKPLAYRT